MNEEALHALLKEISQGNNLGEKITLVGASKTMSADDVNRALRAGLNCVAENKVQEFRDKFPFVQCDDYQFIGHLQLNKVKYLIGKASLIQSVDRDELAEEIDRLSAKQGTVTNVLAEVNIGKEESKSGYMPEECLAAAERLLSLKNLKLKGLMAMLPMNAEEEELANLCLQMRYFYDIMKKRGAPFEFLSVGMSHDYKIAIRNGSNMIRIGTLIFGKRNYTV